MCLRDITVFQKDFARGCPSPTQSRKTQLSNIGDLYLWLLPTVGEMLPRRPESNSDEPISLGVLHAEKFSCLQKNGFGGKVEKVRCFYPAILARVSGNVTLCTF